MAENEMVYTEIAIFNFDTHFPGFDQKRPYSSFAQFWNDRPAHIKRIALSMRPAQEVKDFCEAIGVALDDADLIAKEAISPASSTPRADAIRCMLNRIDHSAGTTDRREFYTNDEAADRALARDLMFKIINVDMGE